MAKAKRKKTPTGCGIKRVKGGKYQFTGANCRKAGRFAPKPNGNGKKAKRSKGKGKRTRCLKWSKGRTKCIKRAKR